MVQLADIVHAQYRLSRHLDPTILESAPELGAATWLKLENANKTHSFKIRGALNAILALDGTIRERGVIACSSGNHAQALAYAAQLAGVSAKILMPAHTPHRKVQGVLALGAEADLSQPNYDEAEREARRLEKETGMPFISPYNDPDVVAGAGTIGLEIVEQVPDVERVIVSVSGGGLISGIATAIKSLKPNCKMIGISAEHTPAMYNIFYEQYKPQIWETLAEALSGEVEDGSITIDMVLRLVDNILLVTEEQIAQAMRWMIEHTGWIVEGGGAVGVAAILHGLIPNDGRKTVVVISGGNVDIETLRRVLNQK